VSLVCLRVVKGDARWERLEERLIQPYAGVNLSKQQTNVELVPVGAASELRIKVGLPGESTLQYSKVARRRA